MKFDIWTIIFQIVNFFLLLYILKRLLFKPIRRIIEERRERIEAEMSRAEKDKEEAAALRREHESAMGELKGLRVKMLEQMKEETEEERKRLLDKAVEEAEKILEKEKVVFQAERRKFEGELKERAVETVSSMATNLLKDLSGEDLHSVIFGRLFQDLDGVAKQLEGKVHGDGPVTVEVDAAYPLGDEDRERLRSALGSRLGRQVELKAAVDGSLIAGVRLRLYDLVYDSSLTAQVQAFRARIEKAG